MHDFVPHQIHLSVAQMKKLGGGLATNLKYDQMGAEKGDVVVMLRPQSARKMLTAYKKGKGMRLTLSPDEIEHTLKHGKGFFKAVKKYTGINKSDIVREAKSAGKQLVQHGSEALGTAVGTYFGNPQAGAMIGHAVGRAGSDAIDRTKSTKKGFAFDTKGYKSDLSKTALSVLPPDEREIVQDAIKTYKDIKAEAIKDVARDMQAETGGRGLYGGRLPKGSAEAKERMAKLRAMKSGGKIGDSIKKAFHSSTHAVGDALTSRKAMNTYKTIGRHAIEQGIPLATTLASMALGDPTGMSGAMIGNVAQEYASKGYSKGTGIRRGRPPKLGGAVAQLSKPFKQALRLNKGTYGLELGGFSADHNAPVSKFSTNPRVRPSSDEMTLSPYQQMSSPAMNPFVPKTYRQEGGQTCGYGGRGLYGGGLY